MSANDLMNTKVVSIDFPDQDDFEVEGYWDHIYDTMRVKNVTVDEFIDKLMEIKSYILRNCPNLIDVVVNVSDYEDGISFNGLRYETPQEQQEKLQKKRKSLEKRKKNFEKLQRELAEMEAELG